MNGKWFLLIYLLYIVALFLIYRVVIKLIEKRKLKKKLDQEEKLSNLRGSSDV